MGLITIILLGFILITLVCILLVCVGSLDNLLKQAERSIHLLKEKTDNLTDCLVDFYNISRDMKYHQKLLREREIMITIEK